MKFVILESFKLINVFVTVENNEAVSFTFKLLSNLSKVVT